MRCPYCNKELEYVDVDCSISRGAMIYPGSYEIEYEDAETAFVTVHSVFCPHCSEEIERSDVDRDELDGLVEDSLKRLSFVNWEWYE